MSALPSPIVLARDQRAPWGVALYGGYLYWTSCGDGAVLRVPVAGGRPELLASSQCGPHGIRVDGSGVYWINLGDGALMRLPSPGAAPQILARDPSPEPSGWDLALGPGEVYWSTRDELRSVSKDGGAPRLLAAGQRAPMGIVFTQAALYWVSHYGQAVRRLPLPEGAPADIAACSYPRDIACDGAALYWTEPGSIQRLELASGERRALLEEGPPPTDEERLASVDERLWRRHKNLCLDEACVYWSDAGNGAIGCVPRAGGEARLLARRQCKPRGLAADEEAIYWADAALGRIMKLPKR